ncbi:MAG: response regulator [Desulfotomaculaceae bacterium]|nr:response regulator [Desulfotomaculaceae bacterium]
MLADVLIADDQAGIRHVLSEVFSGDGYLVETASNGIEALKKVAANPPLLILLDMKMPFLNGLETLAELRKIARDVPVVMMTAYGEMDFLAEVQELGVRHYINKPFDLDEVRYLIKGLIEEEKTRRREQKRIG